jgi:hypothetical protein
MAELITAEQYAKHRKVSRVAVHKAEQSGRIRYHIVNGKQMVDPEEADRMWDENTDPTRKSLDDQIKADVAESERREKIGSSARVVKVHKDHLDAQIKEIRLKKLKGELVDITKAREEIGKFSRTLRDAYLSLPARVSGVLASITDPNEINKVLTEEIVKILEHLVEYNRSRPIRD